jgi:hypothetical protein
MVRVLIESIKTSTCGIDEELVLPVFGLDAGVMKPVVLDHKDSTLLEKNVCQCIKWSSPW